MDYEKSTDEESFSSAQPSSQKEKRERRYECKRCGDKFSLRCGLKLHIRIKHLKLGRWMCAYCDYVTNSKLMLSKHSKVRHPKLPQKCLRNNRGSTEILDDAFWEREFGLDSETETSRSAVTQKRKASVRKDESSEDGTIKCHECEYSCCSPKDMKQHMIKHWLKIPFKCGYCDFENISEYEIKKHSAKMHPMKTFRIIEGSGAGRAEIRRFNTLPVSNMELTKYICLWCEKTYDSELKIQSHHSSQHSSLQLKYSVEKISAPSQIKGNSIPPKAYQCPCCSFSSNNYTCLGKHLRHHVKPFLCGYCKERYESPGKLRLHVQQFHPGCKYKAEYSSDSEAELAVLKSDILINASEAVSEPVRTPAKRENSGDRLGSTPKKLCVARISIGSIQGKKLNAIARKSTTYLPWERSPSTSPSPPRSDPSDVEDNVDQESLTSTSSKTDTQADGFSFSTSPSPPRSDPSDVEDNVDQESLTSTSSKTDTQADGFSFYGRSPSPVDTNKITAYVKFKKDGSGMNMNVATMERIANLYPKVRVRKLDLF